MNNEENKEANDLEQVEQPQKETKIAKTDLEAITPKSEVLTTEQIHQRIYELNDTVLPRLLKLRTDILKMLEENEKSEKIRREFKK